ncbi:hypothetical protein GFL72_28645 [Rhizobium leguminosarum bv. viciae]|nr:hypothetical protein [Rhizobium leguminosarum bv. viciae]
MANRRDGRWLMAAGLVLVCQRPGSAKCVIFMTIEDETGDIAFLGQSKRYYSSVRPASAAMA